MIRNIILLCCIIGVMVSYLRIFIVYLVNKNHNFEDVTGFDLAKELTSNYDEINIVESKEIYASRYHVKRRIIRLTPRDYSNTDMYTLAITSQLSGYSLIDIERNKYLNFVGMFMKNITVLSKLPCLALIISLLTNTSGDAKIGIMLLGIILVYQYLMIQINHDANELVKYNLDRIEQLDKQDFIKIMNHFLSFYTISFVITLILIIREVLIILNI